MTSYADRNRARKQHCVSPLSLFLARAICPSVTPHLATFFIIILPSSSLSVSLPVLLYTYFLYLFLFGLHMPISSFAVQHHLRISIQA